MKDISIWYNYQCNSRCTFCSTKSVRGEKSSINDLFAYINTIPKGYRIVLGGGESTIQPTFFDLVKHCYETDHTVSLLTNGMMFANEDFLTSYSKHKDMFVDITVNYVSHDQTVFEAISQTKNSWNRATQGIRNIVSVGGPHLFVKTVLIQSNLCTLKDTVSFLLDEKIDEVCIAGYDPQLFQRDNGEYKNLLCSVSTIRPILYDIFYQHQGSYRVNTNAELPLCAIPQNTGYYKIPDLSRFATYSSYYGLSGNTIDELARKRSRFQFHNRCKQCCYYSICIGLVPGYLDMYDDIVPVQKFDYAFMAANNISPFYGKTFDFRGPE